jgi:acyl-CoA hydrolase
MVTKHFENITFHLPVRCGEIVDIHCDEPVIGTTSVRFHVYGAVHKDLVFDTIAVFVAIDENGKKKEIVNKTSQWNG